MWMPRLLGCVRMPCEPSAGLGTLQEERLEGFKVSWKVIWPAPSEREAMCVQVGRVAMEW